ncbi:hypothetical protein LZQ00_06065 [Sphingobacterium sp. SRCM116780]|uniref:hypothetical protein n=1 Tax=Sphingobacterium sp. SRCM116780 TaxID=2907623 RepID=UPI001F2A7A57|nr:hypothetical protein [Sphingobacterium sp. SRCM116780]UIR57380.1 hypothetical protein LZQ00_06065 [Sphingobacterium sp. SRCM116780]
MGNREHKFFRQFNLMLVTIASICFPKKEASYGAVDRFEDQVEIITTTCEG